MLAILAYSLPDAAALRRQLGLGRKDGVFIRDYRFLHGRTYHAMVVTKRFWDRPDAHTLHMLTQHHIARQP